MPEIVGVIYHAAEEPQHCKAVLASVMPLPAGARRMTGASQDASALVVFRDPSKRSQLVPELLRAIWGHTPAEAELVLALVRGASADEHAIRCGVAENTVRTHMAALKSKVGVSKMTELVAALAAREL